MITEIINSIKINYSDSVLSISAFVNNIFINQKPYYGRQYCLTLDTHLIKIKMISVCLSFHAVTILNFNKCY